MNKKRVAVILFMAVTLFSSNGYANYIDKNMKELEGEERKKIEGFQLGEGGLIFQSFGLTVGEAVSKLQHSGSQQVYLLSSNNPSKIMLQQDLGYYEDIGYLLKCKKGYCSLEGGVLYMKPTGELLNIPFNNAKFALEKSLNRELVPIPAKVDAEPPSEDYLAAEKLYNAHDYRQAIERYKKFIAENPKHKLVVIAHDIIGQSYVALKDCDAALKQFTLIEAEFPQSVWAKFAKVQRDSSKCTE